MYAVAASEVVSGRNHPSLVWSSANRNGLVAQLRIIAHLYRGEKAVAISMNNLALMAQILRIVVWIVVYSAFRDRLPMEPDRCPPHNNP